MSTLRGGGEEEMEIVVVRWDQMREVSKTDDRWRSGNLLVGEIGKGEAVSLLIVWGKRRSVFVVWGRRRRRRTTKKLA